MLGCAVRTADIGIRGTAIVAYLPLVTDGAAAGRNADTGIPAGTCAGIGWLCGDRGCAVYRQ